jgi:hypothetical protein
MHGFWVAACITLGLWVVMPGTDDDVRAWLQIIVAILSGVAGGLAF